VVSFIERRVLSILQRKGIPQDVLKAVAAVGIPTPHDASDRALALSQMKDEKDLEALAVAFKRTRNILAKYQGEMRPVAPELLVEEAEKSLYEAYQMLTPVVLNSLEEGDYLNSLKEIAGIRGIVDRFFDEVLVMAEDQNLRENRLALLNDLSTLFLRIADISEVVQQGGVS
jgi:glycyl-tRNA synthetase beta chain